jgi:hypothetical protein
VRAREERQARAVLELSFLYYKSGWSSTPTIEAAVRAREERKSSRFVATKIFNTSSNTGVLHDD